MEAFLLAAGLGTRLRPLTNDCPKALVEVGGKTLLEININNLIRQGATRIVVNVHHFADMMVQYINNRRWDAEVIISDERVCLMDTGGGLRKAAPLFSHNSPILIHNVDVLSRIDISQLMKQHCDSKSIATLAVSRRDTSRQLLFAKDNHLCGWQNRANGEFLWVDTPVQEYSALAFSGMAVIDPQVLDLLPDTILPFPIIPAYLNIAKGHIVSCYEHDADDWLDVGKPEALRLAESKFNL